MQRVSIENFSYELPKDLIAQNPAPQRDTSRLLVLERDSDRIHHRYFYNIYEYLKEGDILILNNARVMPCRLYGKLENGSGIEALLLNPVQGNKWEALVKPGKRLSAGIKVTWDGDIRGDVEKKIGNGIWLLTFELKDGAGEILEKIGYPPLPPYIKRKPGDGIRDFDLERYQTVFAEKKGAVAAPTAGLHFTDLILKELKEKGVNVCFITLKVGRGSFESVRMGYIDQHRMGAEYYEVNEDVAACINMTKRNNRRIFAVGTTVVRTLETIALKRGRIQADSGYTDLFISPGFNFKIVDSLVTNFHLPRSTPLILTCAFAGMERLLSAYGEAKGMNYRFLSYGDAMLIM